MITQIADLVNANQQSRPQAGRTSPTPPAAVPELTQEYINWYEETNGTLVNAQIATLNKTLKVGSNKAVRHTRRAVQGLLQRGIAFEDIEPLIKEGVFIYTLETTSPTTIDGTAKPIQKAEQYMLDYYYSVNLIRA